MKRHTKSFVQWIAYMAIILFCVSMGHAVKLHRTPDGSSCQPQPQPSGQ